MQGNLREGIVDEAMKKYPFGHFIALHKAAVRSSLG